MTKILIPKRYVRIVKEKKRPTAHIFDPRTGLLKGRHEKGDSKQLAQIRKKGWKVDGRGQTRVIRIVKPYKSFRKGHIIARTKAIYPKQKNTTLIRKKGKIKSIRIDIKRHKRTSKKGLIKSIKKHKRRVKKRI